MSKHLSTDASSEWLLRASGFLILLLILLIAIHKSVKIHFYVQKIVHVYTSCIFIYVETSIIASLTSVSCD